MEGQKFYMDVATHEMIDRLAGKFTPAKLQHLHNMVDHPDIDFVIRIREDGECWGYMMHALRPFRDPEFKHLVPFEVGKDVFQFDGWVHPDYRGRLIAIQGTNWFFDRRRASGHQNIVVTVRKIDKRAMRYHTRYGFEPIGKIDHYVVGPWRINRLQMDPTADQAS